MIGFAADHMTLVEAGVLADVLTDMGLPCQHQVKPGEPLGSTLRGTNPLERLTDEVKRRSGVIGSSPSRAAVIRLTGAPLTEQNDEWVALRACHMSLETVAPLGDAAAVSLPPLAA